MRVVLGSGDEKSSAVGSGLVVIWSEYLTLEVATDSREMKRQG